MILTPAVFRSIPFFASFEDAEIRLILPFFSGKIFRPDEVILQENKLNMKMYFLCKGTISVFVKDKFIVDISTVGEVLGEMSLANHSFCTATVKAKDECHFLVLSFEEMRKGLDGALKDRILKNFYKGAMEILSNKLVNANKMKVF